jgi:hypothetical protein
MKKLLIPLLALLPFFAQAQFKNKPTAIYFNPTADSLDYKARFSLDSLAKLAPQGGDYQIYITAYTDDQGTAADNLNLADRRANSTSDYLTKAGLKPKKQESRAAGELALKNSNLSPTAQRAQMRRVEIQIDYAQPQNLEDWYNYQAQKNTQHFNIASLDKTKVIFGKKDTRLTIPAQAFQRKADKGAPAFPITFELREAYTFGDMLAQNLTTSTSTGLLQTGGMVYLAATDAKGNALELRPNKEIEIAMPQSDKKALPSDMMLFTADRTGDQNQAQSTWAVTNRPFNFKQSNQEKKSLLNHVSTFKDINQTKIIKIYPQALNVQKLLPKQKISRPDTTKLVKAAYLPLLPIKYENFDKIKARNPRTANESRRAHKARIKKSYAQYLKENSELRQKNNDINRANKKIDSDFLAKVKQQNLDILRYESYQDSLYTVLCTINNHFLVPPHNIDRETQRFYNHENYKDWLLARQNCIANYPLLGHVWQKANVLNTDALRPEFAALKMQQDSLLAELRSLDQAYANADKAIINRPLLTIAVAFDSTFLHIISQNIFNGNLKKYKTINYRQLYKLYAKSSDNNLSFEAYCEDFFEKNSNVFNSTSELKKSEQNIIDFAKSPLAELEIRSQKCEESYQELYFAYKTLKNELGEATDTDIAYNIAQSINLGWINCDRFLSYPAEECSQITINHANDGCTQFFIVVPSISAIVELEPSENQFKSRQYNGFPNVLAAKVVGLNIKNGKISVFVREDKIANLNNTSATFRPCTVAEAAKAFNSI